MTDPRPDDGMGEVLRRGRDDDALEARLAMLRARQAMFQRTSREPHLGDYILLEPIGRGGAGLVYLAFDPSLDRQVAIKLLHGPEAQAGDSSGTEQARLQREALALAKLSHPNVITIFDAGSYDREALQCAASGTWDTRAEAPVPDPGAPNRGSFIVMEYVEGETLKEWQRRPHRWPEVLPVYLDAARGLAAAHGAGLIHRDFKPANVLIGKDGRVRVLDFGLVTASTGAETTQEYDGSPTREVEMRATEDTLLSRPAGEVTPLDVQLTEAGTVMGTPAYMAPEQHRGGSTDPRTDQFSFCASLFEALYGRRAFEGKTLRELREAKEAGPPLNPGGAPRPVYEAIARGLSPRAADRFGSMHELIALLSRDFGARRRRLAWGGAAVLTMGALAAGIGLISAPSGPSCESVADLGGVWDEARAAALHDGFAATGSDFAKKVAERSSTMLDAYARRWRTQRTEVCLREDDGSAARLRDLEIGCLERRRDELDALVDALIEADPGSVRHAIQAVEGLPSPARCADPEFLQAAVEPPDDPELEQRVDALRAELARARARHRLGDAAGGAEIAQAVAAEAQQVDYPPVQAEAFEILGDLQGRLGDAQPARENLERAYWLATGGVHSDVAFQSARLMVITLGLLQNQTDEAMEWADHARLALHDLGDAPSAEAYLLDAIAHVHSQRGDHRAALDLYRQALEVVRKAEDDGSRRVAGLVFNMGGEYWKLGQLEEAHEHLARALEIEERHLGSEHPDVAKAVTNIGVVLADMGRHDEALKWQMRALDLLDRTVGPEHPDNITATLNLGALYRAMERHEEADAQYERALALVERRMGPEHRMAGYLHFNLGSGALVRGDLDAASEHMSAAVAIVEKVMPGHPELGVFVTGLGKAQHRRGEPNAIETLERGLELMGDGQSRNVTPARAEAQYELAQALWATASQHRRALELARAALETNEKAGAERSKERDEVASWLAEHEG